MHTISPGGTPRAFWDPVKAASMPQSSKRSSSAAKAHTPSTVTRQSGWIFFTMAARALISFLTPVDVSTCVRQTILYFCFFKASSSICGSTHPPTGIWRFTTCPLYALIHIAQLSLKYPVLQTRAFSPGSRRLQATKSQPRDPLPAMTNGCPVLVRNTLRSISMVDPNSSMKLGATWDGDASPTTFRTSSWNSQGPGIIKSFPSLSGIFSCSSQRNGAFNL
mmetsp:Transcript_20973/g.29326  ORF Transcript_20973/g.29326 Transcript_20973/m.29326 type:complete len:221 (+) Transcript_20973:750-1412(+)